MPVRPLAVAGGLGMHLPIATDQTESHMQLVTAKSEVRGSSSRGGNLAWEGEE